MNDQRGLTGFGCLNISQFGGAANDNVLKQVLTFGVASGGLWGNWLGEGGQAWTSICLALPFVIFSGFAGQFADKYSKRSVAIAWKAAEIAVALLALWGFWVANVWIVLTAMVLISVQSAFFTPAKFGILPEIIETSRLSRANGTLNMFTYIAVIMGAAVGGVIYDAYAPDAPGAQPLRWLPGAVIVVIAILGTAASLGLPRLAARDPELRIKATFFRTYVETWRDIRGTTLASVIVAWSFFYLIVAGVAILVIPDYRTLLDISAAWTGALMAILGISIGVGDFVAGRLSGHTIRPALIAVGGWPVTLLFLGLGLVPNSFYPVLILLSVTGFMAGFVMVPMQTMIQHLSPREELGRVLGLWSCLSFVGVIGGSVVFLAVKQISALPSNRIFLVSAVLSLVFMVLYHARWSTRFADSARTAAAPTPPST